MESKDISKKWVHWESKTLPQLLFVDHDGILRRDLIIHVNGQRWIESTKDFSRDVVVKRSTSFLANMEGMSLTKMFSFSWAALSGTMRAEVWMGPSEEELETELSPEKEGKEEEVFLFILKGKANINYLEARRYERKRRMVESFSEAKKSVVSKSDTWRRR